MPQFIIVGSLMLAATVLAAEQTPTDSIAAAKAAFQSLKAGKGVPGADKQEMPSVEAPAMIIPPTSPTPTIMVPGLNRDPSAAAKAVQSGRGYMLDVLMKKDDSAPFGTLPGIAAATEAPIGVPAPEAPNPFIESLSTWLSPRDFSLLVGPAGGAASNPVGSGDLVLGPGTLTPGVTAPPNRSSAAETRENPFLANLNLPSMSGNRSDSGLTITSPPPAQPRQPDPPPAQPKQEPAVDLSKRQNDSRFFPQINRF